MNGGGYDRIGRGLRGWMGVMWCFVIEDEWRTS